MIPETKLALPLMRSSALKPSLSISFAATTSAGKSFEEIAMANGGSPKRLGYWHRLALLEFARELQKSGLSRVPGIEETGGTDEQENKRCMGADLLQTRMLIEKKN